MMSLHSGPSILKSLFLWWLSMDDVGLQVWTSCERVDCRHQEDLPGSALWIRATSGLCRHQKREFALTPANSSLTLLTSFWLQSGPDTHHHHHHHHHSPLPGLSCIGCPTENNLFNKILFNLASRKESCYKKEKSCFKKERKKDRAIA